MIVFEEIKDKDKWSPEKVVDFVPFAQTFGYGELQKHYKRDVYRFLFKQDEKILGYVQIFRYNMPFRLSYLYAPYGPIFKSDDISKSLRELVYSIKNQTDVFFRIDMGIDDSNFVNSGFKKIGQKIAKGSNFQPRYEWVINLSNSIDQILSSMHQKTRYSVRLAERKGVYVKIIENNFNQKFDSFFNLLKETSKRNNFSLHSRDYYERLFELADRGEVKMFLAEGYLNDNLLASHLVFCEGESAHYLFGGSSNENKDIPVPQLVHFKSMEYAKNIGLKFYNFGGIDRNNEMGWKTLSEFKRKFGGFEIDHSHNYIFILRPIQYLIYKIRKIIKI